MNDAVRVEKHVITKSNKFYKVIDDYSFKVKNLYNYSNFIMRQSYFEQSDERYVIYLENQKRAENNEQQLELPKFKMIKEFELSKMIQDSEPAKDLMAAVVQQTAKLLSQNWKSFMASIVDYSKNPSKYTGKPKTPNYKEKEKGRCPIVFTNQNCKIKDGVLRFPKVMKGLKLNTKVKGIVKQVRIIPKCGLYVAEIVYEISVPDKKENNNKFIGVDIGVDNFATVGSNNGIGTILNGKGLKSINQYYNKQVAKLKSQAMQANGKFSINRRS